ncbi:hypothetical protein K504DRAFT_538401 [Pleomassaria siparia CBS 279.74]|uniref:Uncharacterized protein n=1 Tax=Pleomassaria siparia CBS 279.74 TaxID=1314801 RepID=A0A6G1JTV5_9PLEO|nr:hypothetical protein K504DRAFT_538401 [Pleomassaria siparia CBS 279.74]
MFPLLSLPPGRPFTVHWGVQEVPVGLTGMLPRCYDATAALCVVKCHGEAPNELSTTCISRILHPGPRPRPRRSRSIVAYGPPNEEPQSDGAPSNSNHRPSLAPLQPRRVSLLLLVLECRPAVTTSPVALCQQQTPRQVTIDAGNSAIELRVHTPGILISSRESHAGPGPDTLTSSGPPPEFKLLPSSDLLPDDIHDPRVHTYTTSLQQRQQQAADYYRAQHILSRASSSSGSLPHSLRRTPNFEDKRPRPRSPPPDPAQQQQRQRLVRFADSPHPNRRPRASSQSQAPDLSTPHPALRISRRTASAIHFVLEEAIRTPHSFTPDLIEERASMSDLTTGGNGRAANGGARTGTGPIPVTQSDRSNIQTPQMIMNRRREREAAREAEAARAADEQQRKADEERRRSAERRAQTAGVAPTSTTIAPGYQSQPQSTPLRSGDSQYVQPHAAAGHGVARQPERVVPTSGGPASSSLGQSQDATTGAQYSRPRATSQSQQQPRPAPPYQAVPTGANESRRPPPTHQQQARRPPAAAPPSQGGPSAVPPPPPPPAQSSNTGPTGAPARQSSISAFPHAFERWETLSSHWEGLTSYWIRRLEQNTDEVRREPLAQQMSRQITDLSAAGANLFHAVVELQRLRASSERKFQRWFYEHRQEQERAQEREAQLENTLRAERAARVDNVGTLERLSTEKKNAERAVQEMRRELQISKEEARRAWEELGRREQEERDRTFSLREGQPTVVGGVQVVPMAQGMGRHGSVSHRPHAGSDEAYGAEAGGSQGIEQHYSYEEGQSPTDTDPYTEVGRHAAPPGHEHEVPYLAQGTYIPSGATSALPPSTTETPEPGLASPIPAPLNPQRFTDAQVTPTLPTTSNPEAFYQQPDAYLHRDVATTLPDDERSYVTSRGEETSEGDEEYAIDEYGNFILDDAGHRVPYRSLRQQDSDEYDVHEDRRRELEHLQRYGTAAPGPSSYVTTSAAQSYRPTHPIASPPDYSGGGYGDSAEWANMRHHHPTRLSDVLEEDERSRTSPSRASQTSRGRY